MTNPPGTMANGGRAGGAGAPAIRRGLLSGAPHRVLARLARRPDVCRRQAKPGHNKKQNKISSIPILPVCRAVIHSPHRANCNIQLTKLIQDGLISRLFS
jgi:hypothetical protein